MPDATGTTTSGANSSSDAAAQLEFPPITRDHILHCSYDYWFPKYRTSCIKSRIIPLTPDFIKYIREDGIVLGDEDDQDEDEDEVVWESGPTNLSTAQTRSRYEQAPDESDSDSDDESPERLPPNKRFPALHQTIKDTIAELDGAVAPKLNWTAPKDAAWISTHQNTIKCTTPNDVYLLLKSSNFITYDLEHAFDDCTPVAGSNGSTTTTTAPEATTTTTGSSSSSSPPPQFKPVLVLRSFFNPHTALEFRCFVKHRYLVGITQRDLNFYEFLQDLGPALVAKVAQFFNHKLRYTFPDASFAFDVYIPEGEGEPLGRVRLIDINAWAPHTDSLLFGWHELNEWSVPSGPMLGTASAAEGEGAAQDDVVSDDSNTTDEDDEDEDDDVVPELRLIEKEDTAAYNFSSPAYSAHKLPKDVVDASLAGEGGMREFAQKWKEMVEYRGNIASWEEK
ncbi:hypothetical protein PG994_009416 [Apiospora phragmitis]|uniref:Cell division cycle protein 123 n=1 Tax=Apiospora phragmitis TaxID=2905665 RepID=A0ABR1UM42_9PEZI